MWDIRMGQTLVSDFPIDYKNYDPAKPKSFKISKGDHKTGFDKELVDGVLVKKDSVSGDWKVVDKFGYSGETPAEKFETYNDLHDNWGVWKDKGLLFFKNNKIDQGEVTPLKDIFDKSHDLGWVGGDVMGAHLAGAVKCAWFESVKGVCCLSVLTQVEQKHYVNYGSADVDIATEAYIKMDEAKDKQFLSGR
jgi:hypothetical protein